MAIGGCGTPVRGSGNGLTDWHLEWTFTDGSGAVSLDTAQSDRHPDIATPVADGGTAITSIRFPKCDRVWLEALNHEPADETTAAAYRQVALVSVSPSAGTAEVRYLAANGGALSDPTSGSRTRLTLRLERP